MALEAERALADERALVDERALADEGAVGTDESGEGGLTLSLDLGSTNFKAALFDAHLSRLAEASVPLPYTVLDLPRAEFDEAAAWQAAVHAVHLVAEHASIALQDVRTLALTSQAQTFALFDAIGAPLTPFVSWMDARAANEASQLDAAFGPAFHAHCSFAPPLAELQLAKILWLRTHDPAALERAARIMPLPTWVAARMAGVEILDRNLAAMSGLYSLQAGGWWSEALALCGIDAGRLPSLVAVGAQCVAAVPPNSPFTASSGLVVVPAGNDQTTGALANGCGAGTLVVTLGTAAVAYRWAGTQPGPYAPRGCWGPYPGGGYYELAAATHGTVALDWACKQLYPGADVTAFFAYAASAWPDVPQRTPPVLFFPDRIGTSAAWAGPADVARRALAVLEGIAFQVRRLICVELQAGTGMERVTVTGGGSRSDLWLQVLADVLACPVRRGHGDALLGAAMVARPGVVPPGVAGMSERQRAWAMAQGPEGDRTARGPGADLFVPDAARARTYEAVYREWERG